MNRRDATTPASSLFTDADPSFDPPVVNEQVWAAMQYIRRRQEVEAIYSRLTNRRGWLTDEAAWIYEAMVAA